MRFRKRAGSGPAGKLGAAGGEVRLEGADGGLTEEDRALLVALAANDGLAPDEIEAGDIETGELGDAQAAAVEELEDGAVAEALRRARIGRLDEGLEFRGLDDLGQALRLLGEGDAVEEVPIGGAFVLEVAIEAVHGGRAAGDGGGGGAGLPQLAEVGAEARAGDGERLDAGLVTEAQEVADIGAVVADRVGRTPAETLQLAQVGVEVGRGCLVGWRGGHVDRIRQET